MTVTNWHLPHASGDALSNQELQVVAQITASFDRHPGFRHPIWDWLASGSYDLDSLQLFAGLYYGHVLIFRKYLAGAITIASVESLQAELAEILAEEYGRRFNPDLQAFGPSHPELFRRFMRSIGVSPEEWDSVPPIAGVQHYQAVHFDMFRAGREIEMMGAVIFGMESTTPYRHERAATGLDVFASYHDVVIDHAFFSRHVEVDPRHGQSLLLPIKGWLGDSAKVDLLIQGAQESFDARKIFLDDLQSHLQ